MSDEGAADGIPPPPWQRLPERAARRRREPISREAIVSAAIELMDAEGFEAFSMRALAQRLGTGAASLYWHVGSKDGLLDLVFDQLIGEMAVPEPDGARWKEQLKQVALNQRATILRHRDLVAISMGRIPMGPHALRYTESVVAILRAGGVPDDLAVSGYLLLFALVNGFTMDEMADPVLGPEEGPDQLSPNAVSGYLASLPAAQFPNIVATAPYFAQWDNNVQFEMLVDLYVDGLAQRAAAARAGEGEPDA